MESIIIVVVMLIAFLLLTLKANHVSKTGRDPDAKGKTITATITNKNKTADKAVVLRARDRDGRRYKVKMKPTEAKLWIKGDEIKIILSKDNPRKYRVLFMDYFRENSGRIREHAIMQLENKVKNRIAAKLVGYSHKTLKAFKMCSIDSHDIFAFSTFMRMIDIYSVVAMLMVFSFIGWFWVKMPSFGIMIVPLGALLLLLLLLKGSVDVCKRIKADAINSAKENKAKLKAQEENE